MTSRFAPNRRTLFKAAGVTATALATPAIVTRAAFAQASGSPAQAPLPRFNRIKVGAFEVTTLFDGGQVVDGPHKIFGINQPQEDVQELLADNFLPTGQMVNMYTPTLVKAGQELVLFDTGLGEARREAGLGQTVAALQAAGYSPEDITIVVLTHFHGDHINGLTEGGQPTFPNARYVANQQEYDFWTDEARIGTPAEGGHKAVMEKVVPLAEKMTFIADGGEVVTGITGMAASGHTPGHMIYMIDSDGRRLALTADTANHFVLSLQRPDWEVSFDMDKAMAAETRKRVFDMVAAERIPFIGYHMPFPALGFVEKRNGGYIFVPETYQFSI